MIRKRILLTIITFALAALLAACGSVPAGETSDKTSEEPIQVMFLTEDLSLEPVTSEDLFADHKITMINVWATFCGYCIDEMPDLEILNQRLEEKDCAIIGVVADVSGPKDTSMLNDAKEIVAETDVTYPNLLPWDGFTYMLPVPGYPTSFFVDSEGNVIGDMAVGARGADDYEALVDEALAAIEE